MSAGECRVKFIKLAIFFASLCHNFVVCIAIDCILTGQKLNDRVDVQVIRALVGALLERSLKAFFE